MSEGGFMSLSVGDKVKTNKKVGFKFLAKGATSGLGIVRYAV